MFMIWKNVCKFEKHSIIKSLWVWKKGSGISKNKFTNLKKSRISKISPLGLVLNLIKVHKNEKKSWIQKNVHKRFGKRSPEGKGSFFSLIQRILKKLVIWFEGLNS